MKVNLIKDSSVSKKTFTDVFELLSSIDGPIKFYCDKEALIDFNEYEYFARDVSDYKDFETKKLYNNNIEGWESLIKIQKELGVKFSFDKFKEIDVNCPHCGDKVYKISETEAKCIKCGSNINIQEYIENKNTVTWDTLFEKCNNYRKSKNIESNEFIILLTEINNFNNWFASLDENFPYNGFIHTRDWNYYINCNSSFPIAFEVIALIIQKYINNNFQEIENGTHKIPIGCINDLCIQKRDIILKLRTADICPECMSILKQKVPFTIIHHTLSILESLRKKMLFSQNFLQLSPLSRIVVDGNKNIYLPDFENIRIILNPLEKTLYMLYLFHPEGIEISSICNFKDEMYNIYSHISNRGDIQEMKSKIDRMADVTSNSASEKISKIKEKFVTAIGSELAQNYYIKGANAEAKKISIDRNLVEIQD
jgi:hypothetical protein